jgi:hypothetical protein
MQVDQVLLLSEQMQVKELHYQLLLAVQFLMLQMVVDMTRLQVSQHQDV